MRSKRIVVSAVAILAAALWATAFAASPPPLVNYQGVLRDVAGAPENGSFDMIFRFYHADGGPGCPAAGGTLLLTDSHTSVDAIGQVTVTSGLFDVRLGEGTLTAGAAATLGEVFRDDAAVYLEIQISGETLCPRIRVVSSAYSLNADHLDGKDSLDLLDTSVVPQTKAGALTLGSTLTVGSDILLGGEVNFSPSNAGISASSNALYLRAGNENGDDLVLMGGDTVDDGRITISGKSTIELRPWGGVVGFVRESDGVELARLDGTPGTPGNLEIGGALYPGNAGESLSWDAAQTRFEFSDGLAVEGWLQVGTLATLEPYNRLGTLTRFNADIDSVSDLFVSDSLEVNDRLFINAASIRLNQDGPEGFQDIYFFEDGSDTGEAIEWDDPTDEFQITDSLTVFGNLSATGTKP
ncbi:MAG TPA: hypothetical protein VEK15_17510, partial [Vicinamibacteria bacterium]|nr:hypothetical protein [Vicinamibacteria bacterium]